MSSPLALAIDALSDPEVALSAALRRLYVVARRIGADDLAATIMAELDGYPPSVPLPIYREAGPLPVTIRFDGYAGTFNHLNVALPELPDHLSGVLSSEFRQPVAELEGLAGHDGKKEPRRELPVTWIGAYRALAEKQEVPGFPMMVATEAYVEIPRTHLRGALDRLRTAGLELALDLEKVSAEAGTANGPTVDSDADLEAVTARFVHITAAQGAVVNVGDGNTVAAGAGATVVQLDAGDIDGLLSAALNFLSPAGVEELRTALEADGDEPGAETTSVLERVRAGGYHLAGGVTGNGAYDGLVYLLSQVFPSFG